MVGARQDGRLRGIFHCFTGNAEQANQIIDLGFYLGIGGVVTYKNGGLDRVLDKIAIEKLVLETDAPYLSPVPYRGKRNESSYIPIIAQRVADILKITVEEVAAVTTANAKLIFNA
jgi:TatD DNase family protein